MAKTRIELSLSINEAVALANVLIQHGGSHAYADGALGRILIELVRDMPVTTVQYDFSQYTHFRVKE